MSRKTKIALPAGVVLDWDDENHRRHIEDEAFSCAPWVERGRPKRKAPERARFWWFWRFWGVFIRVPLQKAFRTWLSSDWKHPDYPCGRGFTVFRWPGAARFRAWLDRGATRGPRATLLRKLAARFADDRLSWECPTCGFQEFHEEREVWKDGEIVRTIDMFELVEGGGYDYYGEANDCHGWLWCWRCGQVSFETI